MAGFYKCTKDIYPIKNSYPQKSHKIDQQESDSFCKEVRCQAADWEWYEIKRMSLSRHNVFYISRKDCTIALLKPMTTFTAETTFKAQLISTIQQIIIQQCKANQG